MQRPPIARAERADRADRTVHGIPTTARQHRTHTHAHTHTGGRAVAIVMTLALLLLPALTLQTQRAAAAPPDNEHFLRTWERTDRAVSEQQVSRTWMWGPEALGEARDEEYAEAPGASRVVQYYDKSRMEITQPNDSTSNPWYVTNGLLVVELITGRMQVGDNAFTDHAPAEVNVAGDDNGTTGPTYATFAALMAGSTPQVGVVIDDLLARDGSTSASDAAAARGITYGQWDDVTLHNIASPFWAFMQSSGLVYLDGEYTTDRLFPDTIYATGRPISEAYWASVPVAGVTQDVLVQCFERRCLTYTPGNPDGWQVEAGNVGQHYFHWRYDSDLPVRTIGDYPVTGEANTDLDPFAENLIGVMDAHGWEAGTLAVMQAGELLLEYGIGWQDPDHTTTLDPDALLRLASNGKAITAASIGALISAGELAIGDYAFCVPDGPENCLLSITPIEGSTPDPRLGEITVQHLLDHKGGWDSAITPDPVFNHFAIAAALGIDSPPSDAQIAQYVVSQPLDFAPGAQIAYANIGYVFLGLIIEAVTGQPYLDAARDLVLRPLGISDDDIQLGRSLPADRDPREPWYADANDIPSAFDPTQTVPAPDGGFSMESLVPAAGLITTASAMATFANAYLPSGLPRMAGAEGSYVFYGSLPGTTTMIRWKGDVTVVVLLNQRTDDTTGFPVDPEEVRAAIDAALPLLLGEEAAPEKDTLLQRGGDVTR